MKSKDFNKFEKAAIGWKILIKVASKKEFVRYKEFGDKIGIHHRTVRIVLAVIQDYCLENQLPPITILVGDASGIPGVGFIAWDIENIDEGFEQVYNYNWNNIENPFNYAITGITEEQIIAELLNNPQNLDEIYAKIKVRGTAQIIFRRALLKAYNSRCAFCGFSFSFSLQAAHIIPWSKSSKSQRLDVRNGILLCANHHNLFDNGMLTVNDDFSINFNPHKKHKVISNYDSLFSTAFDEKKMVLPKDKRHFPNIAFLCEHRNIYEAANK